MTIAGFDRETFEHALTTKLSPTTPIRSPEFLRGREKRLEDIRRSLVQPGRHIFIYGDRGVGKTSLAQTAAYEHQSSDHDPIILACDPSSSFYRMAQDIGSALLNSDPLVTKQVTQGKASATVGHLSVEMQNTIEKGRVPTVTSMNEASALVEFLSRQHSKQPVVVIDEFERITNPDERSLFADFIKQLGDRSIPIRLIFCGVGSALDELLGAHHSCYRYLTTVELDRLGYTPRLEIIDGALSAFSLSVDETTKTRIATISDGFPHYVHLLTEKLLWAVFEDPEAVSCTSVKHYTQAVKSASEDIQAHLKALYEKATKKYTNTYEEILWAVADHHEIKRRSTDIFDSYLRICTSKHVDPLTRGQFNQRMSSLKTPGFGPALKGSRQGWYEFQENILRGYVRLRAEEQGVPLDTEHPLGRSVSAMSNSDIEAG